MSDVYHASGRRLPDRLGSPRRQAPVRVSPPVPAATGGPTFQILRTLTPNNPPVLEEGEFGIEMGSTPMVLWIGVPASINAAQRVQLLPDPSGGGGTGTITGVTAGTGLTGGGTSGNVTLALGTNINLLGIPTAPTPTAGTNTTQVATTAFVTAAIAAAGTGGGGTITQVTAGTGLTGGGTTGNVTLALSMPIDLTGATTPTAAAGTSNTGLASTAFVQQEIASLASGGGFGTITAVAAGSGLAGGGTSGNVTLSLEDPFILDAGTY